MEYKLVWASLMAIVMSAVIRMIIGSLQKNIVRNAEYDEYISKNEDKKTILREGPEAYQFREFDLIKDFRLNRETIRLAVLNKQYIVIFLLNLFLFTEMAVRVSSPLRVLSVVLVIESLLLASFVDLEYELIPDTTHVIILSATFIAMLSDGPIQFRTRIIGMLVGGVFFWILNLLGGMGGGDVKLMATAGFWLGYPMIIAAMFIGVFCAAIIGVGLILTGKKSRKDSMVFGPYLAGGIVATTLFCEEIINFIS